MRFASSSKKVEDVKVVVTGVGAAGVAVTGTLRAAGVRRIVGCDSQGVVYRGRPGLEGVKAQYAEETNPENERGSADDVLTGADVYIGLSQPQAVTATGIRRMAPNAVVFAMANPIPEVAPEEIADFATVIATGRSDYPNQINNVLAFPGDLPRRARRPCVDHHGADGGCRWSRDRRGDLRGGARARLHRPERLQP